METTNPNFIISFEPDQNKLNFTYEGDGEANFLVSIKDIDSKSVIWSYNKKSPYSWCIPTPHHLYSFSDEPDFGGFQIEIYDYESEELFYEEEIRIKFPTVYKPSVEFTKTEPTFINYNEFYVSKVFDELDILNCEIVLDIGANVGLWTSWVLSKNAHRVYAIEPNKAALKDLKRNFLSNSRVTVVDKAIFNENTTLTLNFNDANSLVSSLDKHEVKNTGIPLLNSYPVEAITVEKLVSDYQIEKIDLFKIDIEGIEFTIFESLSDGIFEMTDKFLIETHHFYYDDGHEKVKNLKKKMIDHGFNVKHFATHMLFCEKIR
jgi:FkbM family methyltransferase